MEYIIEEGNHYANDVHSGTVSQEFELEFDEYCWYQPIDAENDYNKVFGWSYGILPRVIDGEVKPAHHYNSIRISWRPSVEQIGYIGLNLYIYDAGVRRVGNVELLLKTDKKYKGKLYYSPEESRAFLDIYSVGIISLDYAVYPHKGYILNPYFGGNYPAPITMTINLTKLDN